MSLIDGLLLTLLNTVACLVLPKMLSVIFGDKTKQESQPAMELSASSSEITTLVDAV